MYSEKEELKMQFKVFQMSAKARKELMIKDMESFFKITFYGVMDVKTFNENYSKVAIIRARDLDEVWQISNAGREEHITRLDKMASVSVGDVIEDEMGDLWVVSQDGFDKFFSEAA